MDPVDTVSSLRTAPETTDVDDVKTDALPRDKDPRFWSRWRKVPFITLLSFFDGIV